MRTLHADDGDAAASARGARRAGRLHTRPAQRAQRGVHAVLAGVERVIGRRAAHVPSHSPDRARQSGGVRKTG